MTGENQNLKLTIFGLNKDQVDNELKKLKQQNDFKLDNIKREINSVRKDNENLTQYLNDLKLEMEKEMQSKEIMEFALSKVEEYVPLINEASENDIKQLTTIGEKTERLFNEKISEFNKIIKQTQEALNALLKDVLAQSENLAERFKIFMQEHSSYKFLATKKDTAQKDLQLDPNEMKSETNRSYSELETSLMSDEVEEFEIDSKLDINNNTEINNNIEFTNNEDIVDGINKTKDEEEKESLETSMEHEIKENDDYKSMFNKALNSELELINTKPVNIEGDANEKSASSFWGEELYEEDKKVYTEEKTHLENNKPKDSSLKTDKPQMESEKKDELQKNEVKDTSLQKNVESKAIASEINNLRIKYLIGKVTGADLLDNKGNVIVAKNSLITNDIINIADKEGKLADLIVNMTLPDVLE